MQTAMALYSVPSVRASIRHHDDVATIGQHREAFLAAFGRELLHGGEDDAARCARQQALQVFAAFGLFGVLAQKILAQAEGGGELIVQIIAVSQDNDSRVLQRGRLDRQPGEERHQEAFTRSLRMPDHADLAVWSATTRISL